MPNFASLQAFTEDGNLNVIIESSKGSRNKLTYDAKRHLFELTCVLPAGSCFPFDFGFIPSTLGEDGDPLDVLVLLDDPIPTGCLVPSRLLGAIEAEQTERDGKTTRNDRLIAVALKNHVHESAMSLDDLPKRLIDEIIPFFRSYNELEGKKFNPLSVCQAAGAKSLIDQATNCPET